MKTRTFAYWMISLVLLMLLSLSVAWNVANAQTSNTGSLTLATTVNADGTLTPKLTWSTTPAATSCSASGDTEWAGTKAASGTVTLSAKPASTPRAFAMICNWPGDTQALLAWQPSTQNTDGSVLTNLAGYRVNWGVSATALTQSAQIASPSTTNYTVTNLTPGTWFFGVKAYTSQGAESSLSNIVSKTMRQAVEWTQQTGIKVPVAPVLE